MEEKAMEKTSRKDTKNVLRILLEKQKKTEKRLSNAEKEHAGWAAAIGILRSELAHTNTRIQEIKVRLENSREILDKDAPRSGHTWPRFDLEVLEDDLKDFLYERAQKFGRSTLSIRYKMLEQILPHVPLDKLILLKRQQEVSSCQRYI